MCPDQLCTYLDFTLWSDFVMILVNKNVKRILALKSSGNTFFINLAFSKEKKMIQSLVALFIVRHKDFSQIFNIHKEFSQIFSIHKEFIRNFLAKSLWQSKNPYPVKILDINPIRIPRKTVLINKGFPFLLFLRKFLSYPLE